MIQSVILDLNLHGKNLLSAVKSGKLYYTDLLY